MPGVTTHADLRARERLGIPRRAVARMAAKALACGVPREHWSGDMRRYLDAKAERSAPGVDIRVYGEFIYIFGIMGTFVTCFALPDYLRLRRA